VRNFVIVRLKDDKTPAFKEANRYLLNAEGLLRKAGRENGYYKDKKYVRLAGHAAYMGILIAVDEYLTSKGIMAPRSRKDRRWYSDHLSKGNRKLNKAFNNAYEGLHLALGYDGVLLTKVVKAYLDEGKRVIEMCRRG